MSMRKVYSETFRECLGHRKQQPIIVIFRPRGEGDFFRIIAAVGIQRLDLRLTQLRKTFDGSGFAGAYDGFAGGSGYLGFPVFGR